MADLEGVVCRCREVRLCGAKRRVQILKRCRRITGGLLNLGQYILGILEGLLHIAVVCVHDADELINVADHAAKCIQRLRRIERHRTTIVHDLIEIAGDAVDIIHKFLYLLRICKVFQDTAHGRCKIIHILCKRSRTLSYCGLTECLCIFLKLCEVG